MKFRADKKRRAPSVIIVSLIDVLMVVLIFLVVSTTFKQRLPALELNLPTASNVGNSAMRQSEPLNVVIQAQTPHLQLNGTSITLFELRDIFSGRQKNDPGVLLNIQADKNSPFGQVVSVRDAARTAGITNIQAQVKLPADR